MFDSAQILGPTTIRFTLRNDDKNWGADNGHAFDTVSEITQGRLRLLSSTRINDGRQFVKDGVFTQTGQPTPPQFQCWRRSAQARIVVSPPSTTIDWPVM